MAKKLKKRMTKTLKKTEEKIEEKIEQIPFIRKVGGVSLIVLGIIGLFLPILQGIALILAGLTMLGLHKKYILKDKVSKK